MSLLSSRQTFLAKYLKAPLFAVIVGLLLGPTVFAIDRGASSQPLPPGLRWGLLGLWLGASVVILFFSAPLKRVEMRDGRLYVSNYMREWAIAPNDILSVRQSRWVRSRPIRVQLRYDVDGLGSHFIFIPPGRARLKVWREDPQVEELRSYAETVHSVRRA